MDLPPKLVGKEVVRRERGSSMASRSAADRDLDSLPVLGAFGEFIESERRRSRTRMLILSGFFLLILILVVGAAVLVGMVFYERVQSDVETVAREMDQIQAVTRERDQETRGSLQRLEEEARGLMDSINQHEEALAQTRRAVDVRGKDVEQELADMKQLVNLLDAENTALKQDVRQISSRLPALMSTMEALLEDETGPPAETEGIPGADPSASDPETDAVPPSFEFPLLPAGSSRAFGWRLPIPE